MEWPSASVISKRQLWQIWEGRKKILDVRDSTSFVQDIVKIRLQVQGKNKQYHGAIDAARKIFAREGIAGFTKGMSSRVLWVAPSATIMFTSYDQLMKRFNRMWWSSSNTFIALSIVQNFIFPFSAPWRARGWNIYWRRNSKLSSLARLDYMRASQVFGDFWPLKNRSLYNDGRSSQLTWTNTVSEGNPATSV